jgi:hypothetical protein
VSPKRAFSDLSRREKAIELLRWIVVLPAAVLGRFAMVLLLGLIVRFADFAGWLADSELPAVKLLLSCCPKEAAFVIAGAKTAPRRRLLTTVILAIAAGLMSLTIHILGQPNPGTVNYAHFAAEFVGAVAGAGYVIFSELRSWHSHGRKSGDHEA